MGKDTSTIKKWRKLLKENPEKEKKEYFKFVDRVMEELYPKLSEKERTKIARETYFNSILKYIKEKPEVKNDEIIKYFKLLKDKYRVTLITTNTKSALKRILQITNLTGLFDIIETSEPEEKDDKKIVFNRFIDKNGKPNVYIGGGRKDSYDYCLEKDIKCIYVNLEQEEDIEGIESVHNLEELKSKINSLNPFPLFLP